MGGYFQSSVMGFSFLHSSSFSQNILITSRLCVYQLLLVIDAACEYQVMKYVFAATSRRECSRMNWLAAESGLL